MHVRTVQVLTPDRPNQTNMKSTAPPALPCLAIDHHGIICYAVGNWIQTQVTNNKPGEGSPEWGAEIRRLAQKFPSVVVTESEEEEDPERTETVKIVATIQLLKIWDKLSEQALHGDSDQEDHQPEDWTVPVPAVGNVIPPSIRMACGQCGGAPNWCTECFGNADAAIQVVNRCQAQPILATGPLCSSFSQQAQGPGGTSGDWQRMAPDALSTNLRLIRELGGSAPSFGSRGPTWVTENPNWPRGWARDPAANHGTEMLVPQSVQLQRLPGQE